jgi:hypothetical protein
VHNQYEGYEGSNYPMVLQFAGSFLLYTYEMYTSEKFWSILD